MRIITQVEVVQANHELDLRSVRRRIRQLLKPLVRHPEFPLQMISTAELEQRGSVLRIQPDSILQQLDSLLKVLVQNSTNVVFEGAARRRRTRRVIGFERCRSWNDFLQQLQRYRHRQR